MEEGCDGKTVTLTKMLMTTNTDVGGKTTTSKKVL
jgi:hypothetical protein